MSDGQDVVDLEEYSDTDRKLLGIPTRNKEETTERPRLKQLKEKYEIINVEVLKLNKMFYIFYR